MPRGERGLLPCPVPMNPADAPTADTLRAWLSAHPDESATLTLSRLAVAELAEELGRLHQSTDQLRKQNKKLRGRIAKLKGGEPDPGED